MHSSANQVAFLQRRTFKEQTMNGEREWTRKTVRSRSYRAKDPFSLARIRARPDTGRARGARKLKKFNDASRTAK